jgi:hypothetical protein
MANMSPGDGAVLKIDEKGRVRTPAARRESLLDEFEGSGLSGTKFAALAGIKYQTFAAWACKRRRQRGVSAPAMVKPADPGRWLEAVVEPAQTPTVMVLQLPCGTRVEVADEKQAALAAVLVRALAKPC